MYFRNTNNKKNKITHMYTQICSKTTKYIISLFTSKYTHTC